MLTKAFARTIDFLKSSDFAPILFIVLAHLTMFWGHYSAQYVFPWDFMSAGYHAETAAWFRDGTIFNPPTWMPYGSMGFPAWWSVQSSAWYLPLQIMYFLGFDYTFFAAAAFQSAHVLVGALGTYYLVRVLGYGRAASCLAALVFHFSSIFFSNAQHIDIIRAAALLPLLLLSAHPKVILRNFLMPAWTVIIVFQYLIAGYPGNIVAAFYTVLICSGFWIFQCNRENRFRYVANLAMAGLAGLLMAQIKYLPLILEAYSSYKAKTITFSIQTDQFWTFLFRHDLPILSQDPTMQSLWSPPAAILLAFFAARPVKSFQLPLTLMLAAIFFGVLEILFPYARSIIPGLTVSRMPHADWRPTLHISMAIFTGLLFSNACRQANLASTVWLRLALSLSVLFVVSIFALRAGYGLRDIHWEIAISFASIWVVAAALFWAAQRSYLARITVLFPVVAATIIASSIMMYVVRVPRTWMTEWTGANEIGYFGEPIKAMLDRPKQDTWARRPARQTYGTDSYSPSGQFDLRFNRAWYAQEFGTFGYDNLRSPEFLRFGEFVVDPKVGPSLIEFMRHPSQAILKKPSKPFNLDSAADCPVRVEACADGVNASADIRSYGLKQNEFTVTSAELVDLVENEMFYHGWIGELCSVQHSCIPLNALSTSQGLRYWQIPPGQWTLTTRYVTPHFVAAKILSGGGFLLMILHIVFGAVVEKLRVRKPR